MGELRRKRTYVQIDPFPDQRLIRNVTGHKMDHCLYVEDIVYVHEFNIEDMEEVHLEVEKKMHVEEFA